MPDSSVITFYQGFENGGYSYVGDEVTFYASKAAVELATGKKLLREDYYPAVCDVPLEELNYAYDPRCRPWYLIAKSDPNYVKLSTFLSLDGT